ncbi:MAG TPA: hypothetical protein VGX25_18315 [Actinophytocola sp.]|uniref:hypothetical protein n=1 Tax=Actinophytocola sp. TaxID=1872138 RepID=UPI002DDCD56D|nr:hypothetical protein [Actinophytocola sp.]HEV2781342.1 hypothetical protein [Actinophytocola sp.]
MDPRERADAILARARARGAFVVTPESATSPMDAASTLQIPRGVVSAMDDGDPEATMVVPVDPGAKGRHRAPVPTQASPPQDEGPAIAQEASTQMLASPGPRRRPSAHEEPSTTPMTWAPPAPKPAPPPEPEEVGGLVPTLKQPPQQSSLSQRLDG